jgi:hypothetical protein
MLLVPRLARRVHDTTEGLTPAETAAVVLLQNGVVHDNIMISSIAHPEVAALSTSCADLPAAGGATARASSVAWRQRQRRWTPTCRKGRMACLLVFCCTSYTSPITHALRSAICNQQPRKLTPYISYQYCVCEPSCFQHSPPAAATLPQAGANTLTSDQCSRKHTTATAPYRPKKVRACLRACQRAGSSTLSQQLLHPHKQVQTHSHQTN